MADTEYGRCRSFADGHRCESNEHHVGMHGADFGGADGFVTWADSSEDGCAECGAGPLDPHSDGCALASHTGELSGPEA